MSLLKYPEPPQHYCNYYTHNRSYTMATMRTRLLFPSCLHGDAARVRKLLSEGADANQTSPASEYGGAYTGETPLFIAAREGHLDIVSSLLAHGADPRKACTWATPADGIITETPLHAAAARGWTSVVEAVRMIPHPHPYACNLNTSVVFLRPKLVSTPARLPFAPSL